MSAKTLHVHIDHGRCQGHALCIRAGARVYDLDDEGYNRMAPFNPPPDLHAEARAGAAACPEGAIVITES